MKDLWKFSIAIVAVTILSIAVTKNVGRETTQEVERRTAQYVREHHCTLYFTQSPNVQFDKVIGQPIAKPGFKIYNCDGIDGGILIRDNEVQP